MNQRTTTNSSARQSSCRVAIVGAGPHGLTSAVHLVIAGVDPDEIAVIDPAGAWLAQWRKNFAHLGIANLRSPAVHHPHPEPFALREYAAATGRNGDLRYRYSQPTTGLFDDFCNEVLDHTNLTAALQRGDVQNITSDGMVALTNGDTITADHVVWATNPSVCALPTEWRAMMTQPSNAQVRYWSNVDLATASGTVAIIGGGLTAAHLVERALERDCHVEWLTRRPVVERAFDTDPGWLGPKNMAAFTAIDDPAERLDAVNIARGGGSVPEWMMRRLNDPERAGRLCRRVGPIQLTHSTSTVATDATTTSGIELTVAGRPVAAAQVWLATGDQPCITGAPALDALCSELNVERVGGRPLLDNALRIPGSNVHVSGRLAQLQLGPTAGNLSGAQRAAERIVAAVVGQHALATH